MARQIKAIKKRVHREALDQVQDRLDDEGEQREREAAPRLPLENAWIPIQIASSRAAQLNAGLSFSDIADLEICCNEA